MHRSHSDMTRMTSGWPVPESRREGTCNPPELEPGDTTVVRAVYRLTGSEHDFTTLMYVEQTGLTARLSGVVTDGWCKGHLVRGEYTEIQHEHDGITTDAWQGTLDIIDAPIGSEAGELAHSG